LNSIANKDVIDCDVAIVGGGIAGPALAAALANSGYSVVLIERSADPLDTARGDHLQPVTCEHLARWGVLETMFERGAEKRLGSRWQTADGELILDARIDNLDIPHPYFLYLNHEKISEALLARAAANPNFTRVCPATARIATDANGPGLHAVDIDDGDRRQRVTARCIALADGRSSRGRKALGVEASFYKYVNPLLLMFAPRTFADTRNDVQIYFTDQGIVSVVPRIREHWKIGLPVPRETLGEWTDAKPTDLGRRLETLVPALAGIQPEIAGVYPVAAVNASRWFDGNAVLLGDACNALHPGRSQGMNIAMRNVADLANRLRAADIESGARVIETMLREFEAACRPAIDSRLDENHMRGLEMDRLDRESTNRMRAAMARLAESPDDLHRYCMNSAGY
jgi:2-polyprenyl-6-methoxyphenol hydroxylase-like FAD-dependent oxidoreductase